MEEAQAEEEAHVSSLRLLLASPQRAAPSTELRGDQSEEEEEEGAELERRARAVLGVVEGNVRRIAHALRRLPA